MNRLKQVSDVLRAIAIERKLRAHDAWSQAELARHRRRKLDALVRYAVAHSPFYRKLYADLRLDGEIALEQLPLTNKRLLMDNFDTVVTDPRLELGRLKEHLQDLRQDECYLGQYRVLATTGTSGLRGLFVYDRAAWRTVVANTIRWSRYCGIRPRWPRRVRLCSIGADNPMHVTQRIPASGDVGLFRVLHLAAADPLERLVAALNRFQPSVLLPYPSLAALLADEQRAGRLRISPEVIATHSEILTEEMMRRIEAAWGIRPFNHYGLTEEPHVAGECSAHRGLHVFNDLCLIEVVDRHCRPVASGRPGAKLLLTNLYNKTQPIIRYEVTDLLTISAAPCPCGRPFPLITRISGRSEDILTFKGKDGAEVFIPPLAIAMRIDALPEIAEYQVHYSATGINLCVVPRPGAEPGKLRDTLVTALRTAVEAQGAVLPPIEVVLRKGLLRSRSRMGKIKLVGTARAKPS
jgi:phenylacetate-coenzyme A ligase PaaK-like adenylate-forming protein